MRCTHLGLPDKGFITSGSIGFAGGQGQGVLSIATDGATHFAFTDGAFNGGSGIAAGLALGALTPTQQFGPIKIALIEFRADGTVQVNFYPYGASGHPIPGFLVPQLTIISGTRRWQLQNPTAFTTFGDNSSTAIYTGALPQVVAEYQLLWRIPPYAVTLPSGGGGNMLTLSAVLLQAPSSEGYSTGVLDNSFPAGGSLVPANFGAANFGNISDSPGGAGRRNLLLIAGQINGAPPAQNIWTQLSFNDSGGNPVVYLSANANYATLPDNSAQWGFLSLGVVPHAFTPGQNTVLTFT